MGMMNRINKEIAENSVYIQLRYKRKTVKYVNRLDRAVTSELTSIFTSVC